MRAVVKSTPTARLPGSEGTPLLGLLCASAGLACART